MMWVPCLLLSLTFTKKYLKKYYTQSGLIRNGPIRNTSEILALFKKWLVELSKLRNDKIPFQISKKLTGKPFQFKKRFSIFILKRSVKGFKK